MATVVTADNPSLQGLLKVDAEGRLLVSVKGGGGGGGSVDLSNYYTKAETDTAVQKASQEATGAYQAATNASTLATQTKASVDAVEARLGTAEQGLSDLKTRVDNLPTNSGGGITAEQLESAVSGIPRTVAILRYANVRLGAYTADGGTWQVPLGNIDTSNNEITDPGHVWSAVRAANNLVLTLPEKGVYRCDIIPETPSTQTMYLRDGQGTLNRLIGPKSAEEAVPLGSGISFLFHTNIDNRLVRIPLACNDSSRPSIGNCTFVFTRLL